jgi:hypothetical protein
VHCSGENSSKLPLSISHYFINKAPPSYNAVMMDDFAHSEEHGTMEVKLFRLHEVPAAYLFGNLYTALHLFLSEFAPL